MCAKGGCAGCTKGCGKRNEDATDAEFVAAMAAASGINASSVDVRAVAAVGVSFADIENGVHRIATLVPTGSTNGWATYPRRAYIAGPMRGKVDCNFPLFDAAAAFMRALAWDVVSPAEHDRESGFNPCTPDCTDAYLAEAGFVLKGALRWDIGILLDHATTDIILLDGWDASWGATLECKVAQAVGLGINRLTGAGTVADPFNLELDWTVPNGR